MGSAQSTARTVGLALLTLTSMAAGFLAASVDTSDPLAAAGTVDRTDRAYGLDLGAGEEVRFRLPDDADPVRLALYDPDDRFFDDVELSGGDTATVIADAGGRWVLLPTSEQSGNLTVRTGPETDGSSQQHLRPLPVHQVERTILEQDDGELDHRFALRLDRRPALAYLKVTGTAKALDASLSSESGRVFEVAAPRLNGTQSAMQGPGDVELSPGDLVPGIYRLEATAANFSGEIELVHQTYLRSEDDRPIVNASLPGLEDQGVPVAAAKEGTAFRVDPQGADRLVLAAAHDTTASVYVYGEDGDIATITHLGPEEGYQWEFGDEDRESLETAEIELDPSRTYVVYIASLAGHGDKVYTLLPGLRTARPAEVLDLRETRIHLGAGTLTTDHSNQVEAKLDGGLVGIELEIEDAASASHRVRIAGPNGLVLMHEERTSVAGESAQTRHQENPAHFSDGRFTVRVDESYTADGDVWVTLRSYEP